MPELPQATMSLLTCSKRLLRIAAGVRQVEFMFDTVHTPVVVNSTSVSPTESAPTICAGGGTS
jgi:hypothetical protein